MFCLVALALLGALPAEHLHAADTTEVHGPVVHRHLEESDAPHSNAPADHDDHLTAQPLSALFHTSPKFAPPAPQIVTAAAVIAPDLRVVSHVVPPHLVPVYSPPPRLLSSRAPPALA